MNVYFVNSKNKERVIATNRNSFEEVMASIHTFLEGHNYKSYYTRTWCEDGKTWFDVGSHTEFFYCDGEVHAE